jgi:predicted ATPase/DNA-binding winged helix-turn-helix (wHTH) protein
VLYRIDEYELDEGTRTLRGPRGVIHVEPQVFDVLTYLIVNRERAVAKTELLDEIWGDQFVSESALTSRIKAARAAIGDSGRAQHRIRTVHGFGYHFVGDVAPLDPGAGPTAVPLRPTATPLPRFHTPLRGREHEHATIVDLLAHHPLVTVVGPGGIGKTRLTVEVAGGHTDLPAVFVDLASVRDPTAVPDTVAVALGIETGQRHDPMDAVSEYLEAVPHLVLLDNCEHVLAAASSATARIVGRAPGCRVLATSREPLGLAAERLYRLGPLPLLDSHDGITTESVVRNPAVAMFLDRARLSGDDVMVDVDDARRIVDLCASLDGLPLALELAAGRVSAFGLTDLVELLDHRLDVLGDRSSVREHRHRTLRSTVEWSYKLLEPDEQRLFRTLAVYPAGITLDGISWLADALGLGVSGIDAAAHLVDASLLVRTDTPSGSRYTQLETLRAFGLDQLEHAGERETALELLATSVLTLLARVEPGLRSPDEAFWADHVRRAFPNIRAARIHLADRGRTDDLVEISRRLHQWARFRDATEVGVWADDLVRRCPEGHPHRATALALRAQAAWRRGDIPGTIASAAAALDIATDSWTRAQAFSDLAAGFLFSGDLAAATEGWIAQYEESGDPLALASASFPAAYAGNVERARELITQARRHPSTIDAPGEIAWLEYCAAETENTVGAAEPAAFEHVIDTARSVDATFTVGVAMVTLASVHAARGETALAAQRYEELIHHWLRLGSWTQQWTTLRHVAELLEHADPCTALTIMRASQADSFSPPALVAASSARLASLTERLEAEVGHLVGAPPGRVEVAELARHALARLAT